MKIIAKLRLTQKAGVKGLEWVVQASRDGLVAPGAASLDAGDHNDLFLQGKMAFAINYSAVLKSLFAPNKTEDFEDVLFLIQHQMDPIRSLSHFLEV